MTGMNGIMKHHGSIVFSPRYSVPVMPILHPSPMNTNNPVKRKMFEEDLAKSGTHSRMDPAGYKKNK